MADITRSMEILSSDSAEFKLALKILIKYEIHCLLQRLSVTGEEAIVITTSISDGVHGHLATTKGEGFLEQADRIQQLKEQFHRFCAGSDDDFDEAVVIKKELPDDYDDDDHSPHPANDTDGPPAKRKRTNSSSRSTKDINQSQSTGGKQNIQTSSTSDKGHKETNHDSSEQLQKLLQKWAKDKEDDGSKTKFQREPRLTGRRSRAGRTGLPTLTAAYNDDDDDVDDTTMEDQDYSDERSDLPLSDDLVKNTTASGDSAVELMRMILENQRKKHPDYTKVNDQKHTVKTTTIAGSDSSNKSKVNVDFQTYEKSMEDPPPVLTRISPLTVKEEPKAAVIQSPAINNNPKIQAIKQKEAMPMVLSPKEALTMVLSPKEALSLLQSKAKKPTAGSTSTTVSSVNKAGIIRPEGTTSSPSSQQAKGRSLISTITVCYICKQMFGSFALLKEHMKSHSGGKEPGDDDLVSCGVCDVKCPPDQMKYHMGNHEVMDEVPSVTCGICHFKSPRDLMIKHMKIHENDTKIIPKSQNLLNKVFCSVCKTFCDEAKFNSHIAMHQRHNKDSPMVIEAKKAIQNKPMEEPLSSNFVECGVCLLQINQSELAEHVAQHNSVADANDIDGCFSEVVVPKGSKIEGKHITTSLNVVKCNKCDYKAFQSTTMRVHCQHCLFPNPQYGCDVCGKGFTSKRYILAHKQRRHIEQLSTDDEWLEDSDSEQTKTQYKDEEDETWSPAGTGKSKPHKCQRCPYSSDRPSRLKEHHKTCGVVGYPYHCKQCGRRFKTDKYLKVHQKKHENGLEACSKCNFSTYNKASMENHQLSNCNRSDDGNLICQNCKKEFKSRKTYNNHKRRRCSRPQNPEKTPSDAAELNEATDESYMDTSLSDVKKELDTENENESYTYTSMEEEEKPIKLSDKELKEIDKYILGNEEMKNNDSLNKTRIKEEKQKMIVDKTVNETDTTIKQDETISEMVEKDTNNTDNVSDVNKRTDVSDSNSVVDDTVEENRASIFDIKLERDDCDLDEFDIFDEK